MGGARASSPVAVAQRASEAAASTRGALGLRASGGRAVGILAAILIAGSVATAQAQLGGTLDPNTTAEELQLDTEVTPQAKESDRWDLVHGAKFPQTETIPESATSFDTDLFALSFENAKLGLAGGSACPSELTQGPGEDDPEFGRRVSECADPDGTKHRRVPTLYRYREPEDADATWNPVALPGAVKPGYIGAIAWIDDARGGDTKALVVGGTGAYPRRDLGATEQDSFGRSNAIADPTDPAKADEAGDPRAWIYDSTTNSAIELDLSALAADQPAHAGMRGFTAVDCYEDPYPGSNGHPTFGTPDPDEPQTELCFAGALGQVWEFLGDEFTGERIDAQSPAGELTRANVFRYRVRDIRFESQEDPRATAVTAGCCAADELNHKASVLSYNSGSNPPWSATERAYSATTPDSLYSIWEVSQYIASPGGPKETGEPSSIGVGGWYGWSVDSTASSLSTARLVSGDGSPTAPSASGWAVGELRSSRREGLGARGLGVSFPPKQFAGSNAGAPVLGMVNAGQSCSGGLLSPEGCSVRPSPEEVAQGWEPVDQKKLDEYIRSRHHFLPSYSANAIEMTSSGSEADGWIVGDYGTILRASAAQRLQNAGATEPKPPPLRAAREQSFADTSAYDGARPPLPSRVGVVPPLGPETVRLDEPRMNQSGPTSGVERFGLQVDQIIMSRDGSEGWALGKDSSGNTIPIHYDGTTWSRCFPRGIENLASPDPRCEGLAPVDGYRSADGGESRVRLIDAERVPLENDADPTNDGEFEVLAITGSYSGPEAGAHASANGGEGIPMLVRYRDGRWRFESPIEGQHTIRLRQVHWLKLDLALAASDEGWVVHGDSGDSLMRFEVGKRFIDCSVQPESCGDPDRRLPPTSNPDGGFNRGEIEGVVAAGDRIYLYGSHSSNSTGKVSDAFTGRYAPLILYRDGDGSWTDGSRRGEDGGGLDPAFSDPATEARGRVFSLSIARRPEGSYEGWAVGRFGSSAIESGDRLRVPEATALLRLAPTARRGWQPFRSPGAFDDYMLSSMLGHRQASSNPRLQVSYPSSQTPEGVFIGKDDGVLGGGHIFGFDDARQRFELIDSGRPQTGGLRVAGPKGRLTAMAPDANGGFWAAVDGYFFHYSDRARHEAFEDVENPLWARGLLPRDITESPDGSIWVATNSNRVFRYDRLLGWQERRVPGWDPGRIVTRASSAEAIAIGPSGEGLLVGEGGRIAQLSPRGLSLDPAAGRSCGLGDSIPCGTSRDLRVVDIASDGSAMVGGGQSTLLWRSAEGEFRLVAAPRRKIVSLAYPSRTTAFILAEGGSTFGAMTIYRGRLDGDDWDWEPEYEAPRPLHEIAIEPSGHGYAVGDEGFVYERSPDGGWSRILVPTRDTLTSVGLARSGGEGVLIGGENGLILTGHGSEFEIARHADFQADFADHGPVVGFAYLPGSTEGSVDAWAMRAPSGYGDEGNGRLIRYRSDPDDLAVNRDAMLPALPDAPLHEENELGVASFGNSDCDLPKTALCYEMSATTTTNDMISQRIVDELEARHESGQVDLAILSGNAVDSSGYPASSLADLDRTGPVGFNFLLYWAERAGQLKHRRYGELVVDKLEEAGVPLFGAIGRNDLPEGRVCDYAIGRCYSSKSYGNANTGENLAWREAFGTRVEPWGDGSGALETSPLEFTPAPGSSDASVRTEHQRADIDGEAPLPEAKAEVGGANTHYAVDAERDGESIARIVVVDTSMRSLAASDPLQQPQELAGGQQRFLERMICAQGQISSFGDKCTRSKDQKAIVVSNTPTYSYGPGALTHTATDATTFEATMLRYDVDLVISGALGYNGLYYTLAPGVHEPCPGGAHPEAPPSGNTPDCLSGPAGPAEQAINGTPAEAEPASLASEQVSGSYPTLIASGAGGKFGAEGTDEPNGLEGRWHGYSVARLMPDGDIVVEQRPILDWIGMDAPDHAISPRARLKLNGYGRSPVSTSTGGQHDRAFHYAISNPAITHRYYLLLANPDEPWLPCNESDINCQELHANLSKGSESSAENPCFPYLCLPSRIGVVDHQSGQVRAGDGKYPETFAIAMLSVDEEVATYPLVFKRSPSFVATPALRSGTLPNTAGTRPTAPPPPPPPPGLPQIPQVDVPQIPPPPGIPQLTAATPPELQPPAPPAPPPPSQQPAPLDLSVAPPGVSISTPTALIQPPTPPVNPAPPGGARREARQRQAAAQKGGADSAEEQGVDMADGPPTAEGSNSMTRQEHAFTAYAPQSRSNPLGSGVLYGSGLTLMALVLAFGWTHGRPTPRRREPELPAHAWSARRR